MSDPLVTMGTLGKYPSRAFDVDLFDHDRFDIALVKMCSGVVDSLPA